MALFHFKKTPEPCCSGGYCLPDDGCCTDTNGCAGGDCCAAETESAVKVLGGGCKNCHKLEENAREALKSLGMDAQVELVTDPAAIAASGVMSTPALMVDGKIVSTGRVLTAEQAAEAIRKVRGTKE